MLDGDGGLLRTRVRQATPSHLGMRTLLALGKVGEVHRGSLQHMDSPPRLLRAAGSRAAAPEVEVEARRGLATVLFEDGRVRHGSRVFAHPESQEKISILAVAHFCLLENKPVIPVFCLAWVGSGHRSCADRLPGQATNLNTHGWVYARSLLSCHAQALRRLASKGGPRYKPHVAPPPETGIAQEAWDGCQLEGWVGPYFPTLAWLLYALAVSINGGNDHIMRVWRECTEAGASCQDESPKIDSKT
jgi:hypothetical protein